MAIIPILFFALVFGFGSVFSSSFSSEAYSSDLTITPDPSAASASPVSPSQVQLPTKLVKQMFRYRQELPACESWQCLQDAANARGNGAEYVEVATTTEGDRITTYSRVTGGALEVFTDASKDTFRGSGPAWTFETCAVPDDVRQGCAG